MKRDISEAFKKTIPVMAGYLFLGFAFGLLMITKGFALWIPVVMSVVIYSGALEFAAVPLLQSAFNPLGAFAMGLFLSIRHIFYGIPMLKKYEHAKKEKPFLIFGLTDETFSLLSSCELPDEINPEHFNFFVTLFDFLYWVLGTTLGALLGNFLPFDLSGLDFAITALFIILFIEQVKSKQGLKSGFLGLISTAAALAVFGGELFVPAALVIIVVLLLVGKKVINRE